MKKEGISETEFLVRAWENTEMRYKVFVDTNILLSGIFFEGNESSILDLIELDLVTSEDVVFELRKVVKKKLKYLKERTFEIALAETEKALADVAVIPRTKYSHKLQEAEFLIKHKKELFRFLPRLFM